MLASSIISHYPIFFSLLLPLREELKIALLWDEGCPTGSLKKQSENYE